MFIISHRGNINGPDVHLENNAEHAKAILEKYPRLYVELDVWQSEGEWYLGHDCLADRMEPEVCETLFAHPRILWHAKNGNAFRDLVAMGVNCFWNDVDEYTITSKGWIMENCSGNRGGIVVMPEMYDRIVNTHSLGVLTDYPFKYFEPAKCTVVIPMSGRGQRFTEAGFTKPKHLLPVDVTGTQMITAAVRSLKIPVKIHLVLITLEETRDQLDRDAFKDIAETVDILTVEKVTEGPACTALLCREHINEDLPLIVSNCDQILEYDGGEFWKTCQASDACVLTVRTNHSVFGGSDYRSYVEKHRGKCTRFAEKIILSNESLVGTHYFGTGKMFIDAATAMVEKNIRAPNGEFYISLVYNELLHLNVSTHAIDETEFWCVGSAKHYLDYWERHNGQQIVVGKLGDMKGGWFIGNFAPAALRTEAFEVGYLTRRACDPPCVHVHKVSKEVNLLVKGKMLLNGKTVLPGDIFVFEPGFPAHPIIVEDCEILCVKLPSEPADKYVL